MSTSQFLTLWLKTDYVNKKYLIFFRFRALRGDRGRQHETSFFVLPGRVGAGAA
jgi:hypothetical protein